MKEIIRKVRKFFGIKYSEIVGLENGRESFYSVPCYSPEHHNSVLKELKANTVVLYAEFHTGPFKGMRCYFNPDGTADWKKWND